MNALFAFGLWEFGGVVLVLVAVLAVLNFRSLKRLWGAASVQAGKVGRWAKSQDPLAVYQERIDEGTEKIAKGRQFLASAAGEVRTSTRKVQELEQEVAQLNNRIDTAERNGDPNNTMEGYALDLADADERLAKARAKLERDTARFNSFSAAINEGKEQVEQARKEARELGMQLEQSQREKEMNEFAASFSPNNVFGDNSLAEARDALQRQIDENQGAGDADAALNQRAAREAKDRELDRKAKAQAILARRAAAKDKPQV